MTVVTTVVVTIVDTTVVRGGEGPGAADTLVGSPSACDACLLQCPRKLQAI